MRVRGRVRVRVAEFEFEFEVQSLSSSPSSSLSLRVRTRARVGALEIEFNFGFEFALGRPGGRSQTPPGNVPGGTPGAHPRDRPEAPGRDPEKHHLEELSKSQRAVGVSPLNCRVGPTASTAHPPSNSPLSSLKGDGLRNNSSSRPLRASVIR